MPARPIRVLVVDDSIRVRLRLCEALRTDPDIEVFGTALEPARARESIQQFNPDVITLDLETPQREGLTFLKNLMEQRPLPVIVLSSLTRHGSDCARDALRLGAMDVLTKPGGPPSYGELGPRLIARIKAAAGDGTSPLRATTAGLRPISPLHPLPAAPRNVILLGASTGGIEALSTVLTRLPDGIPPIAIVQHIPPVFSHHFADRLNELCAFEVREAVDGDRLEPGLALVAPGGFHLLLDRQEEYYGVRVVSGPPLWHQRPAVDMLFKSASDCGAAPRAIAGVFTGMGRDGADGLLQLEQHGAITFAQDEASSAVYGMPRAAWENGGAQQQVPLDRVANFILHHLAPSTSAAPPVALSA